MKKLFIACITVLAMAACSDDDWSGNPGQVLANTEDIGSVVLTSATVGATVYGDGITDRGICWATTEFPTIADSFVSDGNSGAGTFEVTLTNLTPGTKYYVRSYATFGDKTTYGSSRTFTTKPPLTVTVSSIPEDKSIVIKTKIAGGDDNQEITERGVCYGTSANPTVEGNKIAAVAGGKGEYMLTIPSLTPQTTYYVRSYAISEYGIEYSADQVIETYEIGSPKIFWNWLNESEYDTYGIVRDEEDTKFVMHYTMDVENSSITFTYIENSGNMDAKHVTKTFTMNGDATEVTWDPISYNDKTFSGITRNGSAFAASGVGVTLDKSMPANDIYKMFVKGDNGGLGRCSETLKPNWHPSIQSIWENYSLIELNGGFNGVMTQFDGGFGNNWLCHEYSSDIPVVEDVATFEFKSYFWGHADNSEACSAAWTKFEPFRNMLYNAKGVYIIRELKETKTVQQGGFNYFMIRTNGVEWYKWFFRVEGT
ncbi:fibronectin type III domain-containing protein [Bacteroides sp. 519]|uniref:fibronectin type III domain-containing protein n=1 Tax=Bacteroides sp. 519 TaxID=2302937 RepID=UPI0013D1652F|nr:fibronectin type III domain-containing protein [Bacteroides sp. 519]NDV56556.1 hypothetical protein [Bacteroides sp. 519]